MKPTFLILYALLIAASPVFGQSGVTGFLYSSHGFERENDYPAAIAEINKAVELEPGNGSLYLTRARLYRKSGDYNATLENVLLAISLKPDDERFLEFCVTELNLSGNYEESLKIAERLLSLREKPSADRKILAAQKKSILTGYRIRYKTRFQMEDYTGTIEDIIASRDVVRAYNEDKEIKVDPVYYFITSENEGLLEKTLDRLKDEPNIFKYYSELLQILADIRKSLTVNPLRGLMMIEPVDISLSADYAALYEETRTASETAALFEKIAKDSGVQKRIEIFQRMKKYDLALQDLNKLLKSDRDKAGRLSLIDKRGDLFILMNKFDEAIADYETAKKIYKDLDYQDSDHLDKKIAEAKRRKSAAEQLEPVSRFFPDQPMMKSTKLLSFRAG